MHEFLTTAVRQFLENSWLELLAVVLAIAYLLLAVKEKVACWYAGFASTLIFLVIFWRVRLYMESALQVYYLVMSVYGWYEWTFAGKNKDELSVSTWNLRQHAIALGTIAFATAISGYYLANYSNAQLPFVDSFTTWGGVITTFMVARKILENWIYWLVIDSVSIFMYMNRELYFTSLLFCVYIVIIFFGWASWLKSYRAQPSTA